MYDLSKFKIGSIMKYMPSIKFARSLGQALSYLETHNKELCIDYVFLFGSVAKYQATDSSDLDILVLTHSEDLHKTSRDVYDFYDENNPEVEVQFVVRTTKNFVDPEKDIYKFVSTIYDDLILLRRY